MLPNSKEKIFGSICCIKRKHQTLTGTAIPTDDLQIKIFVTWADNSWWREFTQTDSTTHCTFFFLLLISSLFFWLNLVKRRKPCWLLHLLPKTLIILEAENTLVLPVTHFSLFANRWGNNGNSVRLYFGGLQNPTDGDCSHSIKTHLLLRRKAMINPDSILKSRDITLLSKVHLVKAIVFPLAMYGCESWTIKIA